MFYFYGYLLIGMAYMFHEVGGINGLRHFSYGLQDTAERFGLSKKTGIYVGILVLIWFILIWPYRLFKAAKDGE